MDPESSILLLSIFQPITAGTIMAIIVLAVLLICSGLISSSEVAYFSLNPSEVQSINDGNTRNANKILDLLNKPKRLLATILISNNFVNVGIVILSTYISTKLINFTQMPELYQFLIQVIVITFIILLFGEVIPKIYASRLSVRVASVMATPLLVLSYLFKPLSKLLIVSTSVIDKRLKKQSGNLSVDELGDALELTYDEENTSDEEHKILKGIVKFGNTDVKQVMTARIDVVSFEYDTSFDELIAGIIESGFSRVPVYQESPDNVVGILYIKDLLPYLSQENFKWQSLIRSPFFVYENKKIDDLLKEFQEKKIHLAVVVDEYGGMSGIITLEDIIEEIVGEISDEFDEEEVTYSKLDELNYVFEGKTPLNDMYRILDIEGDDFEEEKGESDSLAGFILELAGKIPKKNERIQFNGFIFTIEAADKRKIKRVKVTLPEMTDEESEEKNGKNKK